MPIVQWGGWLLIAALCLFCLWCMAGMTWVLVRMGLARFRYREARVIDSDRFARQWRPVRGPGRLRLRYGSMHMRVDDHPFRIEVASRQNSFLFSLKFLLLRWCHFVESGLHLLLECYQEFRRCRECIGDLQVNSRTIGLARLEIHKSVAKIGVLTGEIRSNWMDANFANFDNSINRSECGRLLFTRLSVGGFASTETYRSEEILVGVQNDLLTPNLHPWFRSLLDHELFHGQQEEMWRIFELNHKRKPTERLRSNHRYWSDWLPRSCCANRFFCVYFELQAGFLGSPFIMFCYFLLLGSILGLYFRFSGI